MASTTAARTNETREEPTIDHHHHQHYHQQGGQTRQERHKTHLQVLQVEEEVAGVVVCHEMVVVEQLDRNLHHTIYNKRK